jgi:hypothetical protein
VVRFACYSCGLEFSKGPPPLEALSPAQASVVGVEYGGDPGSILCAALRDLSAYNFCAFCVRLVSRQLVWVPNDTHYLVHGSQKLRAEREPRCACGYELNLPNYKLPFDRWVWYNRRMRLHLHHVYYPNEKLVSLDIWSEV